MSTYGPTSCAQLRGTPPPMVKIPSRFALRANRAIAREVEERVEARDVGHERVRTLDPPACAFFMAQVERSRPSSESVKAGT